RSKPAEPRLSLDRIGCPIPMAVARHARLGDHVDVRINAAVLWVGIADLEHLGRPARLVDQMVAIGVAPPEGGAVAGTQHLFAGVGDQRQLALQHPDEFVLVAVPVTLAGPGAWPDDGQVYSEQGQARVAR